MQLSSYRYADAFVVAFVANLNLTLKVELRSVGEFVGPNRHVGQIQAVIVLKISQNDRREHRTSEALLQSVILSRDAQQISKYYPLASKTRCEAPPPSLTKQFFTNMPKLAKRISLSN